MWWFCCFRPAGKASLKRGSAVAVPIAGGMGPSMLRSTAEAASPTWWISTRQRRRGAPAVPPGRDELRHRSNSDRQRAATSESIPIPYHEVTTGTNAQVRKNTADWIFPIRLFASYACAAYLCSAALGERHPTLQQQCAALLERRRRPPEATLRQKSGYLLLRAAGFAGGSRMTPSSTSASVFRRNYLDVGFVRR